MDKKIYAPFLQDEIQEIENYIHSKFDSSNYKMKDDFLQIFKAGGKRIRPAFVLLSGNLFKGDKGQLVKLASAIELIHMSTLIHDDIIDQADKRRGEATLNARYGKEWALYAGNYLFAEALEMVDPENNQEIAAVMAASAVKIVEGELLQHTLLFESNQTIREYLKRIRAKTALLLALSCQIGAMAAGKSACQVKKMYHFGYNLGMAFQIIDDILDIEENSQTKKTKGEDLLQGHVNLPALMVLRQNKPEAKILKKAIEEKFQGKTSLTDSLLIIQENSGIDKSKEIAYRYSQKAKRYLEGFEDSPVKNELLRITDSLYERNY